MISKRGQIIVISCLTIAIVLLSIVVLVYKTRLVYLETRSIVVREVVGSITADFERASAHVLALATRAYYNYSRFYELCSRYSNLGLSYGSRHNFTIAREIGLKYLDVWKTYIMEAYTGYGVQVDYEVDRKDITIFGRPRTIGGKIYDVLMKGFWYHPSSASVIYSRLKLNLTNVGFYGWRSDVLVGLYLLIHPEYNVNQTENLSQINITVYYDKGKPYPYLITKGFIEIYYPDKHYWRKANITDVTYIGAGNYTVKFHPAITPYYDPIYDRYYLPLMVVVGDDRGIIVEAATYDHITFKIKRNIPDTLYYYDGKKHRWQSIDRPQNTRHEIYTLEFGWDLNIYWLGTRLQQESDVQIPPIPYMPIKQLRVNVSIDGTQNTLLERPIQYENWKNFTFPPGTSNNISLPIGLADPQKDFNETNRLVFQVKFPTKDIDEQLVAIWWIDDLDVEPAVHPTQIHFYKNSTHKDVWHPLYDVEFLDIEHQTSRRYVSYRGVAAFVMRDPLTDFAFGPVNIHAFDTYTPYPGLRLPGRYRPYGNWTIYYKYMRYSWIEAPIRIFAVLNTTLVADVYTDGDVQDNYYYTIAIVEIINGTRYIPVITHIYWTDTHWGNGYWLTTAMGRGFSRYFAYLRSTNYENSTDYTPFKIYYMSIIELRKYPGFLITHWMGDSIDDQMGRAIILNEEGVSLLHDIGNGDERFVSTKYSLIGLQGSIEYCFWPYCKPLLFWCTPLPLNKRVDRGRYLNYWFVLFDYKPLGGEEGWISLSEKNGWKNAYIYAPMFLEDYAPTVVSP